MDSQNRLSFNTFSLRLPSTIPGVQKAFDFDVTLADVESVAEETGWEPKESPSRADISDKDDNFSFKDIVLSSFHQELDRHYEGYVHCEVALLAHLHGRSAGTYIGVRSYHVLCATDILQPTGRRLGGNEDGGSHGQLGQWFLPSLSIDDDDQRIRNLMAANLLKTITDHLCQLETDPMVITRFRNRHQLLSQSSVGSKDSDKVSFRTDTQGLRGVSSAVLLGDEGPTSELKKRLLAQDVS
ncbi:hypothetical protein B0H17DRAFT_1282228 [Mycena rosella]|uniref:Uncharacterized protein n=1 Tax=Mycena rosella TaxID=1033263 RepID=A0AAD7GY83_MYCRO|nr:hypothetical protein B0H17DRAFT_1282228 [Mycena rosella]